MDELIGKLNVVIAELNLAAAKAASGAERSSVIALLDQAKTDLAEATRTVTGQNPVKGDT